MKFHEFEFSTSPAPPELSAMFVGSSLAKRDGFLHVEHCALQHDGLHEGIFRGCSRYVPDFPSLTYHSDNAL